MGFRNPLVGGITLVRSAIQSNPYVTGVSGWSINRDGTAEFNSGTFRGSIQVGNAPGQRFIVNNTATGDPLDIYDSSNHLVFSINAHGVADAIDPSTGHIARMTQGQLQLNDGGNNDAALLMLPASTTAQRSEVDIIMSPPVGVTYTLRLIGGSDDGSKGPTLVGQERNVQGAILQSDQTVGNNLIHAAAITGTTDASGFLIFNHGATFKDATGAPAAPSMIFCQVHDTGTPTFGDVDIIDGSITATQAKVFCSQFNGVARTGATVKFWILCIG